LVPCQASTKVNQPEDAAAMSAGRPHAPAAPPSTQAVGVAGYAKVPQSDAIITDVLAAEFNILGGPKEAGKSLLARDWAL
jgi:hypothetical protein